MTRRSLKALWKSLSNVKKETVDECSLVMMSENNERRCSENLTSEILKNDIRRLLRKSVGSSSQFVEDIVSGPQLDGLPQDKLNVIFLWASFHGHLVQMQKAYNFGANLFSKLCHYNALHFSALSGSLECTRWLVEQGCNVNVMANNLTPLHCAVLGSSVEVAEYLIQCGCQISNTTIHSAVSSCSVECLKLLLLSKNINVNAKDDNGFTALHIATELGYIKHMKILLSDPRIDVNIKTVLNGYTALHLAAEEGYTECIKMLLYNSVNINEVTHNCLTALQLACKTQYTDCVKLLLKYGAEVDQQDMDGRTALHFAVASENFSLQIVETLITWKADVNIADKYGFTPLHIAVLNKLSDCVEYLISNGANVTATTKGGISALHLINRKLPASMSAITTRLDDSVELTGTEALKYNFRDLIQWSAIGEIGFLYQLTIEGNAEILKHPLCRAFLHLKWSKIKLFYMMRLLMLLMHTIFFSIYILADVRCFCKKQTDSQNITSCILFNITITAHVFEMLKLSILMLALVNLIRVVFSIPAYKSVTDYFSSFRNILLLIKKMLCFYTLSQNIDAHPDYYNSLAAISALCCWAYLMLRIGQLPFFGTYIAMYTKVQKQFVKLLLAYSCLLAGFTVCFCIIYPKDGLFENPFFGLVKVFGMMTGELELSETITKEKNSIDKVTLAFLYIFFIGFITVILMNLLVGISVNDVEKLQRTADLMTLQQQISLIYYMEVASFHGFIPNRIAKMIKDTVYVVPNMYRTVIYIRPHNKNEKKLPKDIVTDGLKLTLEQSRKCDQNPRTIDERIDNLQTQMVKLEESMELIKSLVFKLTEHTGRKEV